MRLKWIFPILGLLLFAIVSVQSYHNSRSVGGSGRYFRWSIFLLDSRPLKFGESNVVPPLPEPNWADTTLRLTAFPAFFLAVVLDGGVRKAGISEIWYFMISVPILISAWYYIVGLMADRLLRRVLRKSAREEAYSH